MEKVTPKERLKRLLGPRLMSWYNRVRLRLQVPRIFLSDYRRYRRHSAYFHRETPSARELEITVLYHSLEKGFLHEGGDLRLRFGRAKVARLLQLLQAWREEGLPESSQIIAAQEILSAYYSYHREREADISDYFPDAAYAALAHHSTRRAVEVTPEEARHGDFATFAPSRHSIRRFSDRPVPDELLREVIRLTNTAPSACNRQEVRVHSVSEPAIVREILDLQGGFRSESEGIRQLLLVTADLTFTYMEGMDRQQPYIDGGIYLMNLLYALHYHGVGACAGNASLLPRDEARILSLTGCRESEALIAIVPIGFPATPILTTPSRRRPPEETLLG